MKRFFKSVFIVILFLICFLALLFNSTLSGFDFYNVDKVPSTPPPFFGNHAFQNAQILYPSVLTPGNFIKYFQFNRVQKKADYGQGERIVLIEEDDDYSLKSMSTFDKIMHLPNNIDHIHVIRVDDPAPDVEPETMLDVEWLHSLVPLASIYILEIRVDSLTDNAATEEGPIIDAIKHIQPNAISVSYGMTQPTAARKLRLDMPDLAPILWDLSRSYPTFIASGDHGSDVGFDAFPDVVSVGGIEIRSNSSSAYSKYALQPWPQSGRGSADFIWYHPSWQSSLWRKTPDVSMLAATPYVWVYSLHQWVGLQGTSIAAPIWAGIWVLTDRLHVQVTGSHLPTDVNQILYTVANKYPATFIQSKQIWNPTNQNIGLGVPDVPNFVNILGQLKTFPKKVTLPSSAFGMISNNYTAIFLIAEIAILALALLVYLSRWFWLLEKKRPGKFKLFLSALLTIVYAFLPVILANMLMNVPDPVSRNLILVALDAYLTYKVFKVQFRLFRRNLLPKAQADQSESAIEAPSNPR